MLANGITNRACSVLTFWSAMGFVHRDAESVHVSLALDGPDVLGLLLERITRAPIQPKIWGHELSPAASQSVLVYGSDQTELCIQPPGSFLLSDGGYATCNRARATERCLNGNSPGRFIPSWHSWARYT